MLQRKQLSIILKSMQENQLVAALLGLADARPTAAHPEPRCTPEALGEAPPHSCEAVAVLMRTLLSNVVFETVSHFQCSTHELYNNIIFELLEVLHCIGTALYSGVHRAQLRGQRKLKFVFPYGLSVRLGAPVSGKATIGVL